MPTELLPSSVSQVLALPQAANATPTALTLRNYSVAQQAPAAATRTYLTGSKFQLPPTGFKVGSQFRWKFNMAKTAAGSAASTFDIAVGSAGTTADTARVSFTKPAGTAAADEGWVEINATVRVVSATVGVIAGTFTLGHNLSATGHAVIPFVAVTTISGSFDNKTQPAAGPLYIGVCLTSGASDVITVEQMQAEAFNL